MNETISGQMSLADFCQMPKQKKPKPTIKPGDWLNEDEVGRELRFKDLKNHIGELVAYEATTVSRRWFKAIRVDKIHKSNTGELRLIYYDGGRQRGMVSAHRFDPSERYPVKVYEVREV